MKKVNLIHLKGIGIEGFKNLEYEQQRTACSLLCGLQDEMYSFTCYDNSASQIEDY